MQYMSYERESTAALATEVVELERHVDELDKIAFSVRSTDEGAADRIWAVNAHFQNMGDAMKQELLRRYIRANALDPVNDDDDDDSYELFNSDEFQAWIKRHAERNK